MTTKELSEAIRVMQAFEDGKKVQRRLAYPALGQSNPWFDDPTPLWNWINWEYRIKPKEPRVCWRNEYSYGLAGSYRTKGEAMDNAGGSVIRQVKFVEEI